MNLLGRGSCPEFWSKDVREKECFKAYREYNLKQWESMCCTDEFTALPYHEYKVYSITGERNSYQRPYYRRRVQLGVSAILSLIYPEESKYLDYLMDKIFEVCNEYSWCIPAHQPDYTTVEKRGHIDLFAAETGHTLSQIYHLLGQRLEPLIRDRIRTEIDRRIIASMRSDTYAWEIKSTNNWSAVCMGSVISTVILMRPELFDEFMPRAKATFDRYLSGFGDDGYCLEGVHYWHYGFGFFMAGAEIIRIFTEGKIDYFKLPKVKKIATFIQKMYLSGMASVSFADSGRELAYHIGICHMLHTKYPDAVKVYSPAMSYIDDGCGRFTWRLTAASWLDEELYFNPTGKEDKCEYYGESAGWLVKRTESFGFAAKAGNNGEHHNHNDVGSFIFARDERQIFCDIGSAVYSKQYFNSATRYDFIQCSSLGHSVPYLGDGIAQRYGSQYRAKDVRYTEGRFSFDMADAYGDERLRSLVREFKVSDGGVTVTDSFDIAEGVSLTERFALLREPRISGLDVLVEGVTLEYDRQRVAEVSYITVELPRGNDKYAYLLDFKLKAGVTEFCITIK